MNNIELNEIGRCLVESRTSAEGLDVGSEPGVYAFFVKYAEALGPFKPDGDGLVYVGLSDDLARREYNDHLRDGATGSSTLRRSIGAILKGPLMLTAIPRGRGRSNKDCTHYRFTNDGEHRLTVWMKSNLEVGVCAVDDPDSAETVLIPMLEPVLNLVRWKNPAARDLRALRKICADEARLKRA